MVDKSGLLKELIGEFEAVKKEFGLTFTLDEFDSDFTIRNVVLDKGFVPCNFCRFLSSIMVQGYREWHGYLNNLLIPSPGSYASQTEAKLFSSESDKKMLWDMVKKTMEFSSRSSSVLLNGDLIICAKFVNEMFADWENDFKPKLMKFMTRVNSAWKGK